MTAYNQHTFTSVFIGPTGHQHDRDPKATDTEPTAIDCDVCAPYLASDGWVFDPKLVPLTDRQIEEQEKRDREGAAAIRQAAAALADGLAESARKKVSEKEPDPEPKSKPEPQAEPERRKPGPKPKAEKEAEAAAKASGSTK